MLKFGKDKLTSTYVTAPCELLETYWKRFMDGHHALLAHAGIEISDYITENHYGLAEESNLDVKSKLASLLKRSEPASPSSDSASSSGLLKQIQLSRISLPTFSGDQLAWEGFRDLFKSLVHNVDGLAPVQKMTT
ncbi:hypothetical protein X777_06918 [Ooceraea biroi]|uniref:Uncharacterized protein n=1 Tax=Ooceraea biroi TaxID=2015173 RepID=A0A026WCG1_OOCBI|nr:hypothetical protein X777_06918 [Ooceraea biroi]